MYARPQTNKKQNFSALTSDSHVAVQEGVSEAIMVHGVNHGGIAHFDPRPQLQGMRGTTHVLHAPTHHHLGIATPDGLAPIHNSSANICKYLILFFSDDAFCAGLRKLGPKNSIPEVFLTRKAKNMNHGSPLFPTI